jgi:acyl-CoA thioesterase
MDARSFLGLEPTHNPHRRVLPVVPGICAGGSFLVGGCGLGAAIAALEGTTGRPVIWATAQYLDYARPPEVLDIDVTVAVTGKQSTQARAVGHVADREILTVNAALGARSPQYDGQWEQMPAVPPPSKAAPRMLRTPDIESINTRMETRLADARDMFTLDGTPGTGRASLWTRIPDILDMSAAVLGIMGDFVPFGVGQAIGIPAGGNSLDNTLRVAKLVPTEWVLCDVQMHAITNGFGHGLVHLWAEDGTLLATASQSCIVRTWKEEDLQRMRAMVAEGGQKD